MSKYNPDPYFKKEDNLNNSKIPWSHDVLYERKTRGRGNTVSPMLQWYIEEKRKKDLGLYNEIDLHQIKAAIKGFKNLWSEKVGLYPVQFSSFLESKEKKLIFASLVNI